METKSYQNADIVFTLSSHTRESIIKDYDVSEDKAVVVYVGVNIDETPNPTTHEELINAYQKLENYIYDLSNYAYFNMHEFIFRERIAKICSRSKKILDYGAGIGDMCIRIKHKNKTNQQ